MYELEEAHGALQSDWRALAEQWQTTREAWRDNVAAHFERNFWEFYATEIPKLLLSLQRLDEALDDALQHTEEP